MKIFSRPARLSAPQPGLRPGTLAPRRRRMASGMTLIEIICVVAILGIFAVVLLRALVREIDYDVSREERGLLRSYNESLKLGIRRNGYIPSQNEWAELVAGQTGADLASVAQNRRHQERRLLIDNSGWLNTVTLPWVQTQAGTSIIPTNARVMIVSSLGKALPALLPAGPTAPAVFDPLWNGTNNFAAGAWAGWGGQATDVLVEPVNLTSLFVALYIVTAGNDVAGWYTIGTNTTLLAAPNQLLSQPYDPRYLLAGTSVNLCHAWPSNTLDSIQILNKDSSFIYERGVWKSSAAGGILPGGVDIAAVVNAFLKAPYNENAQNKTPYPEVQQYLTVAAMMDYMSNYIVWAKGSTSTTNFGDNNLYLYLRNNLQPNMMTTIQGLFMGVSSYYPTNSIPCN
ncbi:MAG TPA: type II secretion system protein [Verrucomicrobiae bacterium]